MTEVWLQTYRAIGKFTFRATQAGLHKFHIIGSGGNGVNGGTGTGSGGAGGGGGGYGIHSIGLSIGEAVEIEISQAASKVTHDNNSVISTAGKGATPGTCSGANDSNLRGNPGGVGKPGSYDTAAAYQWKRAVGGSGGAGAKGVGKYQSDGGTGGNGGSASGASNGQYSSYNAQSGASVANTDSKIGGAGGSGGNGAQVYDSRAGAGAGAPGQLGGVVIEFVSSAPMAPPWIDVDTQILAGGEPTVTWGTATDINGDLIGYVLQRSADGGAWTQLYQGSLRTFTDVIDAGWNTVQYRVSAYDAEGSGSGYISTGKVTIIHNTPPTAPPSLYLPEAVYGGSTITVSWGQSTDADNNLTGYTLEQCVDGGTWTEIADTTGITANAEITFGWQTVQFRVRAYDSYGAVGEYALSEAVTIVNNRTPVISGEDRDLGAMIDAFVPQTYTVTDEDGDVVTIVEKLDGVVRRAHDAVLGAENTLELAFDAWRKLLNGSHVWHITATDAKGAATARSITFTKQEGRIDFSLLQPLAADAMPERCILSIQGAFPVGSVLVIEVCNNAFDEAPDWNDITNKVLTGQKHYFSNTEKTAERWGVGVRASLERGAATGDCYIHSIRGNYA